MNVTSKGRYALYMMIDIAQQGANERTSLRAVSERQGISLKYAEQMAKPLVAAGLLNSTRGAHGGYALAKPAAEISVADILHAAEGNYAPVSCVEKDTGECPRKAACQTFDFWEGLDNVVNGYLEGVKLDAFITGTPKWEEVAAQLLAEHDRVHA